MKTKIIYISGSEVFQMSDVRAAFDTVRQELGLGTDTVLFGVPVDADDALGGKFEKTACPVVDAISPESELDATTIDEQPEIIAKPKRTRKKIVAENQEVVLPDEHEHKQVDVSEQQDTDSIIPILSVLGGEKESEMIQTQATTTDNDDHVDIIPDIQPVANFDITDIDDDIPVVEPEPAKIQDTDDSDDSLEKLLQSVQSLHEDKEELNIPEEPVPEPALDETDLTLEKLATEFAETQDKIVNTTKSSARGGRIGKLKNILPFKREKRNDSSLMGDLFGWAGVAANDEEFGIPEFFPTAAKK